jgi:hypothetical protein
LFGRTALFLILATLLVGCAGSNSGSDPRGCRAVGARDGTKYELCYRPNRRERGTFIAVRGPEHRVLEVRFVSTSPPTVGHWAAARLSSDGKRLIATWSGECETLKLFSISIETGRARALPLAKGC